ncbi:MAG: UDP-N-acetylglucosamine 1-carboxyvinyltransferase [Oscillospiraceae bacterium]|nr:UDP-N-acetylglucosamine 1-carboxyvinyltransferase [Oscillospiraceae bacterium]
MEKYVIRGGKKLSGEVVISGAKNAVVAILAASILSDEPCVIENIPNISDVTIILQILAEMGANVRMVNKTTVEIDPTTLKNVPVPYEKAKLMRASSYFLGTLLGRFCEAHVSMPGGCNLGDRPIDQHLKCFAALGASYTIEGGMVNLTAERLVGNQIFFDKNSVGATINAIMAASKADGLTIIENAAKEPHVVDLANFLNSMGADILGAGTDVIKIRGVKRLHGTTYCVIPDQIEAGTFMAVAAATKSDILIKNVIPKHLEPITRKLVKIGVKVEQFDDAVRVVGGDDYVGTTVKTQPHPGFPTDMQPQMAAVLTCAKGASMVTESIFDNRFRYVDELRRMGANISVEGRVAVIEGVDRLKGAPVKATDLRAGAALIVAALGAEGTTEIYDIFHVERGYENMELKLRGLGADICKVDEPDPAEAEKPLRKAL